MKVLIEVEIGSPSDTYRKDVGEALAEAIYDLGPIVLPDGSTWEINRAIPEYND